MTDDRKEETGAVICFASMCDFFRLAYNQGSNALFVVEQAWA
ncbi:MAG: hypothetical protein ACPGWR_24465 [Ardenticatenaceae bacterium]